jgi:histidinol-phosphate aminotransferase
MPSPLDALVRPDIADLHAYTPIVPPDVLAARLNMPVERIIKLDANENPFGPSPCTVAALADAARTTPDLLSVYPDPDQSRLRTALSRYTGQPEDRIICGAGSDQLIDLLMRLCLTPGDVLLDCPPTFGMYAFNAGLYGARVVNVQRDDAFDVDPEEIAEAAEQHHARLIFLAAPNNPTGNRLPRAVVERLLDLPLILAIDEAYYEFAGDTVVDLVGSVPNLVVLRTFSKWAGLAGLRVGYGLGHPDLMAHLWKIKDPYNVNGAAQLAALAALEDIDYLMDTVRQTIAARNRLAADLAELPGVHVYPSETNFLLCRLHADSARNGEARARDAKDRLFQRGILIRYFDRPGLRDCIRISIGRPEQNATLVAALHEILGATA